MMNPLFSLCVYIVEVLIAHIFFSEIFENTCAFPKKMMFCSSLAIFGSSVNLVFLNNSTINGITTFAITVILARLCFQAKIAQCIFYSAILAVINMTTEVTTVFIGSAISDSSFLDYNNNCVLLIFQAITSKLLFLVLSLILVKVIRPPNNHAKIPVDFLIYPISVIICLVIFWHVCAQPGIGYMQQLLLSIASVCLFVSAVLLFITYSNQITKDSESLQMKSELTRLQTEQSYYQILDQQNQQLMLYAHDAKKHLAAIQSLNDDPQINSYVSQLAEQLADYTRNCHSGNKLLDVIIQKYIVDCEIRKIHFEYDVKVCNLIQIKDIDLVAILGNLMDNAITAAEHSTEKIITLHTVRRNAYSVIVISNSCDIPPKRSGNKLLSTKADAKYHGFGLKSVEKTICKYQGDYDWEYNAEKKIFTVTVMIAEKSNASINL